MELEFERKGLRYLKPLLQEVQTREQTQELRLTEGMPDVGRVLGTWGQVILRSKEWRGDCVACSGGVMAHVLYAPEDGSGPRAMESWIPFQMKWDLEDLRQEGELRMQCLLRFLDARSVSPRKLMLRCGVGVMAEAYREDTAMVSIPGTVPEDVQLRRSSYPVLLPMLSGEKSFQLEEELTLPLAGMKELVACTVQPRIGECRIMSGKLVFRGSAGIHGVFLSESGNPESTDLEVPLSQFVELEGALTPDARGDVRVELTGLEPELSGNTLRLRAGLLAQYVAEDRQLLELVEDAYSPERTVEPKLEELELPGILDCRQASVPVRQTIRHSAEKIVDVTYLQDFPSRLQGDGVQLALPGMFQVVFRDENGMLQYTTARTEENWDMPAGEDSRTMTTVFPGSVPTANAGSGIELKAEPVLQTMTVSRRGLNMVTGLQLGDARAKDPARPSLILRRAGAGSLWDIAKSTGSTVEAIRQANSLEGEPEESRILLIPVS